MKYPAAREQRTFLKKLFTVRHAAALLPPIILLLGALKLIGLGVSDYQTLLIFIWILTGYTLTSTFYFWTHQYGQIPVAISLIAFHVFIAVLTFMVVGFLDVSVVLWLALMLSSFAYFATRGFVLSVTAFTFAAFASTLTEPSVQVLPVALIIATSGYVLARRMSASRREKHTLTRIRDQQNFEREQLLALVNTLGDAVLATDMKGSIRLYNSTVLSLLDTNTTLEGASIDKLLALQDSSGNKISILSEAKRQKVAFSRDDLLHVITEGECINLAITVAPIRPSYRSHIDGGFIFTLRDITKRKSLEEERDEFISVVSHELRTPVAIAEGSLSNLLLMQDRGMQPSMVAGAAKVAHEQIMYLAKMVNDLSTLSRAERGVGEERELIDLNLLLKTLYEKYEPEAKAKKLHLNLDVQGRFPSVVQSRLYLEETMQNFITNAIKYTQEGSVTISAVARQNGVECAVSDTGIGISKSDQKKIFQKFYRSEDYRTRETNGTGLGLYVVYKLAKKMGVMIELKSRLNHGSRFSFVLPIDKD